MERVFLAPEVESVEIDGSKRRAEITIRGVEAGWRELITKISRLFSEDQPSTDGQSAMGPSSDSSRPEKESGSSIPVRHHAFHLVNQA